MGGGSDVDDTTTISSTIGAGGKGNCEENKAATTATAAAAAADAFPSTVDPTDDDADVAPKFAEPNLPLSGEAAVEPQHERAGHSSVDTVPSGANESIAPMEAPESKDEAEAQDTAIQSDVTPSVEASDAEQLRAIVTEHTVPGTDKDSYLAESVAETLEPHHAEPTEDDAAVTSMKDDTAVSSGRPPPAAAPSECEALASAEEESAAVETVVIEEIATESAAVDDRGSEQWFNDDDDGDEDVEDELIPVAIEELSDDDEPVFVGSTSATDAFELVNDASGVSDGGKRKREDEDEDEDEDADSDATVELASDSEEPKHVSSHSSSSSSSSSSSNSSSGSSSSSSSDSERDGGQSKKRPQQGAARTKKARHETPPAKVRHVRAPAVRRTIPPEYDAFDSAGKDGRDMPILHGSYKLKNQRAVFSGQWGFSEADFAAGGPRTSKFEYTSVKISGRSSSDRRPFSGKYSGYFNFRQFSGRIVRVKEEQVELNFLKMPRDDRSSGEDGDDAYEEDEAADSYAKYEVYGKGRNRFGRFLIRGYLNPAAGSIGVKRKYLD